MNFAQMLLSIPQPVPAPVKEKVKRVPGKAWEANRKRTREWFNQHLNTQILSTSQIAAKRGQENSSCLPLLYELEQEGFLLRAGRGERIGRGQKPVLWKLAHPPVERKQSKCSASN